MLGKIEAINEKKEINYSLLNRSLQELYFPELVTRYSVLQKTSSENVSYLIVRDEKREFFRIMLNGLIHLKFGKKICLLCGKSISQHSTNVYCENCTPKNEAKYKNCLFNSPKKVYQKKCVLGKEPCLEVKNREKCFSKYYLYFGRLGETIKAGISKLSVGKYKYKRLIEQGLNEAIIVYPFKSLAEVTNYERLLIDEFGLEERLSFEDKVNNLLQPSLIKIEDYYPINQIKELFYNKKIKKIDIYPDNTLENVISSSFTIKKKKIIEELRGTIIFTQGNIGAIKTIDELTFFDISKIVGKIIKRSEKSW